MSAAIILHINESLDLLNNIDPFQERGDIVKYIKMVDFSTNQNAAKVEFSIESSSANLLHLFIGVEFLK